MIRAFTGPTDLDRDQRLFVAYKMLEYPRAEVWRSGCAYGVDTVAAYLSQVVMEELELYIPRGEWYNGKMVNELAGRSKYNTWVPQQKTSALTYRTRNWWMLVGKQSDHSGYRDDEWIKADHLLAFVRKPTYYRSGEWMTIRYAVKFNIPYDLEVLP